MPDNPQKIQSVMDDPRSIWSIRVEGYSWCCNQNGVRHIRVYREGGEMGYVPWFAIYKQASSDGDLEIKERINGKMVIEVTYANN